MKRKTFLFSFSTAVLLTSLACYHGLSGDTAYDWPRWRGPNGDGISLETGWNPEALSGGPKVLWKVRVGTGYSNVAVKGNLLYTIGYKMREKEDVVLCLDAETGEEIWRYTLPVVTVIPRQRRP